MKQKLVRLAIVVPAAFNALCLQRKGAITYVQLYWKDRLGHRCLLGNW